MPTVVGFAASFDGASFLEQAEGGWYAEPDELTIGEARHIPGTNTNDFQEDGDDAVTFEMSIGASGSQMSGIRAKRKTSGTLVYHAGSITVYLKDIVNTKKADGLDGYKATLRFVIL